MLKNDAIALELIAKHWSPFEDGTMRQFLVAIVVAMIAVTGFISVSFADEGAGQASPTEVKAPAETPSVGEGQIDVSPEELERRAADLRQREQERKQRIEAANAAYDKAVAKADADFRAAVRANAAKKATLKEQLAALHAARSWRSYNIEGAAETRCRAYAAADALVAPREPTTDEEHYLTILRDVGPKIEAEYIGIVREAHSTYAATRRACVEIAERIAAMPEGEAKFAAEARNAREAWLADAMLDAELTVAKRVRAERYDALRAMYFDHRPQNKW